MDAIRTSRPGWVATSVAITSSASASSISIQVMPYVSRPALTSGRARIGRKASALFGRVALYPGSVSLRCEAPSWPSKTTMTSGQQLNSALMPLRSSAKNMNWVVRSRLPVSSRLRICAGVPKQARNSRLCPSTSSRGTPVVSTTPPSGNGALAARCCRSLGSVAVEPYHAWPQLLAVAVARCEMSLCATKVHRPTPLACVAPVGRHVVSEALATVSLIGNGLLAGMPRNR